MRQENPKFIKFHHQHSRGMINILSRFLSLFLGLSAIGCGNSVSESDVGDDCKKSQYLYLEMSDVRFKTPEVRFKIPTEHARKLTLLQTDDQKKSTPIRPHCSNSQIRWIQIQSINFNANGKNAWKMAHEPPLPLGVTHFHVNANGNDQCTQNSGGMEKCRLHTTLSNPPLKIAYDVRTGPYTFAGKARTEADWPYKYYAREAWPALEKAMQTYVQGLVYQESDNLQ